MSDVVPLPVLEDERVTEIDSSLLDRAKADYSGDRLDDSAGWEQEGKPVAGRGAAYDRWRASMARKEKTIELLAKGYSLADTLAEVVVSHLTYKQWRVKFPKFRARVDATRVLRRARRDESIDADDPVAFSAKYFGMAPAWFQILFIEEMKKLPPGNILLVLWPPGHGKTTTFENYANWKLATNPAFRFMTVSENQGIARKINGRVMDRMSPNGPSLAYVRDFGPFVPQIGTGETVRQPWTDTKFRVYKARTADERNFSMEAVGQQGGIVSARTDQMHIDDMQSMKTINLTEKMAVWLRQDALSRPGEEGITTICGTKVDEEDIYAELTEDSELDGILKVIRLPAVITDPATGNQSPLWPEKHTLDSLDRMRRKVGAKIWDRNWMQDPGASSSGEGTFPKDVVERCYDIERSVNSLPGDGVAGRRPTVIIGVDPALGGHNVICVTEVFNSKLIPRRFRDEVGFERNEQIMAALESEVRWANSTGVVTNVVIEDKNFQLGLRNDDRMIAMAEKYGFTLTGHMTGLNKYDENMGIASMPSSFINGEVIIPMAPDNETRTMMTEFVRQLFKWKAYKKGNKLRQDQLMAFWFCWLCWRANYKDMDHDADRIAAGRHLTRQTMGWVTNPRGLFVPR